MKIIHADLPSDVKDNVVKIFPLSDVHIEEKECDYKALLKWREHVLNEPNHYVILNGDLINLATRKSVSDVYGSTSSPDKAIDRIVEFLTPIKDRILAMTTGNHESRGYKEVGVDISRVIAKSLGIEDKYACEAVTLFISFGKSQNRDSRKQIVSLYVLHGMGGGGKKVGSKLNSLEDLANIIDVDCYVVGHTHLPATFRKQYIRTNLRNRKLMFCEKVFINSNAWLGYGGYGQMFGYAPSSIKYPILTVKGFDKTMEVVL